MSNEIGGGTMLSEAAAKPPYREEVKALHPVPTAISAGLTVLSSLHVCLLRRLCAPVGAWLVWCPAWG